MLHRLFRKAADVFERLAQNPPAPVAAMSSSEAIRSGRRDEIIRELAGYHPEDSTAEAMRAYLEDAAGRFVITLDLVPDQPGKLLELGASPYLFTLLLRRHRHQQLHLANYFSAEHRDSSQRVVGPDGSLIEFPFSHFNVEIERFPYDDGAFEVVLCGEIIEHLVSDPVAALAEIRRVLTVGGLLVLTTPNAARLENLHRLLTRGNVFDQYSGFGPYGRHNREYTLKELETVVADNGFVVDRAFTAPVHPAAAAPEPALLPGVAADGPHGQHLFLTARKTPDPHPPVRPGWLYRNRDDLNG